jgi:hypothetical protein
MRRYPMDESFPLFTRKQGCELIRTELGVPIPPSRFDKDAMEGDAPEPTTIYGRQHLYTRDQILEYGRSLIRGLTSERLPGDSEPTRNATRGGSE